MNEMLFRCSSCNDQFRAPELESGRKTIDCPKCGGVARPLTDPPALQLELTPDAEPQKPPPQPERPKPLATEPVPPQPQERRPRRSRYLDDDFDDRPSRRRRRSNARQKADDYPTFKLLGVLLGCGVFLVGIIVAAVWLRDSSARTTMARYYPTSSTAPIATTTPSDKPRPDARIEVPRHTERLKDLNAGTRANAAEKLGGFGKDSLPAIPALLACLDDEDETVRTQAARAIRAIGSRPVSVLLGFIGSWQTHLKPATSKLAREGLPLWEVDTDVDYELANDFKIARVPTFVVVVNGKESDRSVGEPSEKVLRSMMWDLPPPEDPALSDNLDDLAVKARWLAVLLSLVDNDVWVSYQGRRTLQQQRTKTIPTLIKIAGGKYPDILRSGAVKGIGIVSTNQPNAPEATAFLETTLAQPAESAELRGHAAVIAHDRKIANGQIVPALIAALKGSEQTSLRADAATRLGDLRSVQAIPALIDALKAENVYERYAVVAALGKMESHAGPALPALFAAYDKEEEEWMRTSIRMTCEQIVPTATEASPQLVKALKEGSDKQRLLAVDLLGFLEDKDAGPLLVGLLESKSPALRVRVAIALYHMRQNIPAATAVFIAALNDEPENHQVTEVFYQMGKRALPALVACITEEKRTPRQRMRAAQILTSVGREAKSIRPALEKGLTSQDRDVRLACAAVLAHITPHNEAVVAPLAIGLDSGDRQIRQQCATALSTTKQAAAAKALLTELEKLDGGGEAGAEKRRQLAHALASFELAEPELDRALALLTKPNSRSAAAVVLSGAGDRSPKVAPALIDAFAKTEEDDDHEEISETLSGLGKSVVPGLLRLFEDVNAKKSLRLAAVRILGQMDEDAHEVRPTLVKYLNDPDKQVRWRVAITLAFLQSDADMVPSLLAALNDEELGVEAQSALTAMGPRANAAIDPLLGMLKGNDATKRSSAVRILGEVGRESEKAGAALIAVLKTDEDATLRQSVTYALPRHGERTVPALMLALTDPSMSRADIIRTLQQLGVRAKEASPALAKLLLDNDRTHAAQAAVALSFVDPKEKAAVPVLVEAIRGKDPALRNQALSALGAFGPEAKSAVPLLVEALQSAETRYLALAALTRLGPDAAEAVEPLLKLLSSREKGATINALAAIGPAAAPAIPKLVALLEDEQSWYSAAVALGKIGEPAKRVVPILAKKLADEELRYRACQALGFVGKLDPDSAVEPLTKLLAESDALLHKEALRSLGSLQTAKAVPPLLEALKSTDLEIRRAAVDGMGGLGAAGETVVSELIKLLGDKELRLTAVYSLGRIGAKAEAAIPELVKLLDDATARFSAVWALGQFGPRAKDALPKLRELAKGNKEGLSYEVQQSIQKIENK